MYIDNIDIIDSIGITVFIQKKILPWYLIIFI
jgi:hypothetical protein